MNYGYVGLGNLGGHLAASLIRAGHQVTVYDRDASLAERHAAMGATVVGSAAEVAAASDHVFTCLPSPAVSEVVLATMMESFRPGATWIENSTLGRDDVLRLAGLARSAPSMPTAMMTMAISSLRYSRAAPARNAMKSSSNMAFAAG